MSSLIYDKHNDLIYDLVNFLLSYCCFVFHLLRGWHFATYSVFFDLHLSYSDVFILSSIYDKRNDLDCVIVIFFFLIVMFRVLSLTGFTFLNLFYLLECLVI